MSKHVIALDVDDVLMENVSLAAELVGVDPGVIDAWDLTKVAGLTDKQRSDMYALWRTEAFVKCQQPYAGAEDFVNRLIEAGYEVIVASSVPPEVMSARGLAIRGFFPNIPERNIMLGGSKRLLNVDVLVDDNLGNLGGCAKHSILFAQDSNRGCSSPYPYPRTNSYEEIFELIREYTK